MTSEGCAAHPVGYISPLQTKMAIWRIFLNLYFLAGVWEPATDYNGCLAQFKRPLLSAAGCHTQQDHSAEQFAEGGRVLKAAKAL